jgi:hypothetical protein
MITMIKLKDLFELHKKKTGIQKSSPFGAARMEISYNERNESSAETPVIIPMS